MVRVCAKKMTSKCLFYTKGTYETFMCKFCRLQCCIICLDVASYEDDSDDDELSKCNECRKRLMSETILTHNKPEKSLGSPQHVKRQTSSNKTRKKKSSKGTNRIKIKLGDESNNDRGKKRNRENSNISGVATSTRRTRSSAPK